MAKTQRSGSASVRRAGGKAAADASPLGQRLRTERDRLGLSVRELSRRLDVSPSLVSQIETGKIQPSVRTLYAMVSELGVSLDELFGAHDAPQSLPQEPTERVDSPVSPVTPLAERVQRADSRQVIELESGVRWERLITWNDGDIDFLYAIYHPGGASAPDGKLVRHNGREFGIVIKGHLGVTVGFENYVLEPGDSISFESTTPHRLHNDGDEDVEAIWVVLGRNR